MKKPSERAVPPSDGGQEPEFGFGLCPGLRAFLTDETWDDGSRRVPGTVLVLYEEGRFKGWVNDKALNRSAWVSAPTLSELFLTIDEGVTTDTLDWRRARPERARGSR